MNTKICTKCGKMLSFSEFSKSKSTKDGLMYTCKQCGRKLVNEFRKTPVGIYCQIKGRTKFYNHKPFRLTKEEFLNWYKNEPKKCVYCDIPEEKLDLLGSYYHVKARRFCIDCKDNKVGYVLDNLALAYYRCNFIKADIFSFEEMKKIGQKYLKTKWKEK